MKIIKGFENEDIIVSDFGEWVGKNYIDYKSEYKNNQKIIKSLSDENSKLKDNWNKLKEKITDGSKAYSCRCYELVCDIEEVPKEQWNNFISYLAFNVMQELIKQIEQGSDSNV